MYGLLAYDILPGEPGRDHNLIFEILDLNVIGKKSKRVQIELAIEHSSLAKSNTPSRRDCNREIFQDILVGILGSSLLVEQQCETLVTSVVL